MIKQTFEKGDRVFDIRFGWGKVVDDNMAFLFPIGIQFDDDDSQEVIVYTDDGKLSLGEESPLLSFTEYTLQGFSQEKPVNYEKYIGKWGQFWDSNKDILLIGKLLAYDNTENEGYPFENEFGYYANFEPLTEEQIKVLGLCN